jgi:hypothetical protein
MNGDQHLDLRPLDDRDSTDEEGLYCIRSIGHPEKHRVRKLYESLKKNDPKKTSVKIDPNLSGTR